MLLHVSEVLPPATAARYLQALQDADWADGAVTAGFQSAMAKRNRQLPSQAPLAQDLGCAVEQALMAHPLFLSAALPARLFPPLFNRYAAGEAFGTHVDNAIRYPPGEAKGLRTDLSATLFLSDPGSYDGGELIIQDTYGEHQVKLPAGDMVLYPASSLHRVTPVTRGERVAAFFWIQSLVRDDGQRTLLFELDGAIQEVGGQLGHGCSSAITLTGVYHNLLRRWATP